MDDPTKCYPRIPDEIRDYYEKASKGLIEESPFDYWGPETEEEKAHWDGWRLPIRKSFSPIDWNSKFTGRGIAKRTKKAMEKPGLVGPMGEMLVMNVDPVLENVVYKVVSRPSSESGLGKRVKHRRRSSLEAAGRMYKRLKKHFFAFERKRNSSEVEPDVKPVGSFVTGGSCVSHKKWMGQSVKDEVGSMEVKLPPVGIDVAS